MATFVTNLALTPLYKGTRLSLVKTAESAETVEGVHTPAIPKAVMASPLKGAKKISSLSGILAGYQLGQSISSANIDSDRQYRIMESNPYGKRIRHLQPEWMFIGEAERNIQRVAAVNAGESTYGVHNGQTDAPITEKQIRRWPRDWHGDNMKQ